MTPTRRPLTLADFQPDTLEALARLIAYAAGYLTGRTSSAAPLPPEWDGALLGEWLAGWQAGRAGV